MSRGKHKVAMILVCFLVKVFIFFAEASRKQTFHAEALKDPEPICMEDRIMKNGSPTFAHPKMSHAFAICEVRNLNVLITSSFRLSDSSITA